MLERYRTATQLRGHGVKVDRKVPRHVVEQQHAKRRRGSRGSNRDLDDDLALAATHGADHVLLNVD